MAQEAAKETITALEEVVHTMEQYRTIDADKIKDVAEALTENIIVFPGPMIWVCRLRQKSNQLFSKSLQAAIYLTTFGRHLDFMQKNIGIGSNRIAVGLG